MKKPETEVSSKCSVDWVVILSRLYPMQMEMMERLFFQ